MLNWLVLLAILGIAGWASSFLLVMLLTLRMDGKPASPNSWLSRNRWATATVLAVIYFIVLGNAIGWRFGSNS